MVSKEQRSLLLLHQCILDTGAEVVRSYTEPKITYRHGGSIAKFLDAEKHFFYHQWNGKKNPCCACPPSGCSIIQVRRMDQTIFDKMYTKNQAASIGHQNNTQFCICRYSSNNIDMDNFDLTDLNFLLKSQKLVQQKSDEFLINKIMTVRCIVFHAVSSKSYNLQHLANLRADFETAVLQLAEVAQSRYYRKMVQLQLSTKMETVLSDSVVETLLLEIDSSTTKNQVELHLMKSEIKEFLMNSTKSITNYGNGDMQRTLDKVKELFELLENNMQKFMDHTSNEGQNIKAHHKDLVTDVTKIAMEAQEQICEDINAKSKQAEDCINKNADILQNCVKQEVHCCQDELKENTAHHAQNIKDYQQRLGTEITNTILETKQGICKNINESTNQVEDCLLQNSQIIQNCVKEEANALKEVQRQFESRLYRTIKEEINKVKAEIKIEIRVVHTASCCKDKRCVDYDVRIDSKMLKDDHAKEILSNETISKTEEMDLDQDKIEINSVETNCLLLEARSSSRIFRSEETFRQAIIEMLVRVLEAGEIDISIESTVHMYLTIITPLNEEEIKVVLNITNKTDVEVKDDENSVYLTFGELTDDKRKEDRRFVDSEGSNDNQAKNVLINQTTENTQKIELDQDKTGINSGETNCLLLKARSSSRIFRNEETFREAVIEMLRRVLEAGEVDTGIESPVHVYLSIITPLNEEEMKVVFNIANKTNVEVEDVDTSVSLPFPKPHDDERIDGMKSSCSDKINMSKLDGRTRCAKFFIITTENCKTWLLQFVEGRLLSRNQTLLQFILANNLRLMDPVIDRAYREIKITGSSKSADVSALYKIIRHGKILQPNEEKSHGSSTSPTIGDQIDRIRLLRNDLMHINEATLDEQAYSDRLADLKEIAKFFERINSCLGKYTKEIDDINIKIMDKMELEFTMKRYKRVVNWVRANDMTSFTDKTNKTNTRQIAAHLAPIGQAVGGFGGGATGLFVDVLDLFTPFH